VFTLFSSFCVNLLVISVSYRHMLYHSSQLVAAFWLMLLMLGYYCRPSRVLLLFLDTISTLMVVYVTSPEEVWALRPRGKPLPCSTSYVLRWRRSIFGHRPSSCTRRQAGDSPHAHAGAAALAVVFSGNEPRHRRLVYIRRFRFWHQLSRPTVWLLRFWTCDHWITNLMMC